MQWQQGGERRDPSSEEREVRSPRRGRCLCATSLTSLFQGKGWCSSATQILLEILKTFPAKYRWTKYMSIKRFGFTKSTFSNILPKKSPVQHNIHENNEHAVRSLQPERMHTFIWFTYDYTDWPLIHSFTLFPPDAFAHWQTIFFLNQSARKNVSSICRNSYDHHLINLPSCHCGVTGQNSTLSKSHVRN